MSNTLIVITGPTASGKSVLAISVAKRLGSEIISADSRQIYKGLPIATAQPTAGELAAVPHHLVATLQPEEYYSASCFEQDALSIAERLWSEGKTPVVCGGSMMYVDTLCHGIDPLPTVSRDVRAHLQEQYALLGDGWLRGELLRVDADYYHKVDLKNMKRVFHAVEITREAGEPYSAMLSGNKQKRCFRILKFAIDYPREELFERINTRVDRMVEAGLVEEVRRMLPRRGLNSLNTVGVKEIFDYFDGRFTLEEAISRLKKNTRVYAKKQLTWLKRDDSVIWLKPGDDIADEVIRRCSPQ